MELCFQGPGCGLSSLVIWILAGLMVISLTWGPLKEELEDRVRISYSQFCQHVQAGELSQVTVSGQEI